MVPTVGRYAGGWLAVKGVTLYEAGYPRPVFRRGWLCYASVCRYLTCVALLHVPMVGGDLLAYRELVRSLPRLNLFSFNDNKRSVLLILYISDLAELRYSIGYFGLFIQAK